MSSDQKYATMQRGKRQALYKYLPHSWIDFSVGGRDRYQFLAQVDHWVCEEMKDVNADRLLKAAIRTVKSFEAMADREQELSLKPSRVPATTFGVLTKENCRIVTPKDSEDEPGIIARISPKVFYCGVCRRVYYFKNKQEFDQNRRCTNPECGHPTLRQFRQTYSCRCGNSSDYYKPCPTHGYQALYWNGDYKFDCRVPGCGWRNDLARWCECGEKFQFKAALDPSHFFAFSFALIDLIDERLEKFLSGNGDEKYFAIANYIGLITQDEFRGIVEAIPQKRSKDEVRRSLEASGLRWENSKEKLAEATANEAPKLQYPGFDKTRIREIRRRIRAELPDTAVTHFLEKAEMVLEFCMVDQLENKVTLEMAAEIAKQLRTNYFKEKFKAPAKACHFSQVSASESIPFITCTYGYTRVKSSYEAGVSLRAFQDKKTDRNNLYAVRMNTEGVLFEFDRRAIVKWLLENQAVFFPGKDAETSDRAGQLAALQVSFDEVEDPDTVTDEELKLWLLRYIDPDGITSYNPIAREKAPVTYYVYQLIHTISHLLIRAAADIGGLGKDSLSEYIFPGIPAVLIYVQNSQGFNLGSLASTFEAQFDKWVERAYSMAQKCVFDPLCIERHKACTGCLFLNEVSCQHYNRDLDRSLVIGHIDKVSGERIIGFWEDAEITEEL